jgi:hypothetical protein
VGDEEGLLNRAGDDESEPIEGLLHRALRRFRLPLRESSTIEETAKRNRAERLFAVNYRSTWTR